MFDLETVRVLGGAVFAGTIVGVLVLGRIAIGGRKFRAGIVAKRKQVAGAEQAWAAGSAVVQLWSLGVLLLPSYFYGWPAAVSFPGDHAVQAAGLALWVGGLLLVDVSAWVLGRFLYSAILVRDDHRLVQQGPYRWIRHPMYTANVVMALGLGILFLSPPLLILACLLAAIAVYRAHLEEDLLRSPQAFGRDYEEYMARTGRFLPRIRAG